MEIKLGWHCVYIHTVKIEERPLYIGEGKSYRPFMSQGRGSLWNDYVRMNLGELDVEILGWFEDLKLSLEFEKHAIKLYDPICNIRRDGISQVDFSKKVEFESNKATIYPDQRCVYHHRVKSEKQLLYIGKGWPMRAWDEDGRNEEWIEHVKQNDGVVDISTSKWFHLDSEALEDEKNQIKELKLICNKVFSDSEIGMNHRKKTSKAMIEWHKNYVGPRKTMKGRHHTDETKMKLRLANLGKCGPKHTEESKAKLRLAHLGKKLTEEHKKKLSDAKKGKPSGRKGILHTQETKDKISETVKQLHRSGVYQ